MTVTPRPIRNATLAARFGAARADITPPVGIYNRAWGAAQHDCAEGVHLALTATALAIIVRDEQPLVMLALDLGWLKRREDDLYLRGRLLEALDLPEERVVFALSHTHSGPSTDRTDAARPGGHLIAPYLDRVHEQALSAARAAIACARPGTLSWAYGACALATNRDLPAPDGTRRICGYNPAVPSEQTVLVGRALAEDGAHLATVVNYACHPTSLAWRNRLISPDYIGAMRATVEAATAAPCLFLQGPSGDLAPREQYRGDTAVADLNGRQLGHAALAALAGMLPASAELRYGGVVESGTPLAIWECAQVGPARTVAAERLDVELEVKALLTTEQFRARLGPIAGEQAADAERVLRERMERAAKVRALVGAGPTTTQPFYLWRLGGAYLVAQPHEGFSPFQRALRAGAVARDPDATVAVVGLANGPALGYLPRAEDYDLDLYQVWQTPFARGSLERVSAACDAALARLAETPRNGSAASA